MEIVLLTTAYLPTIDYIKAISEFEEIQIEAHENYQKRTYRNRSVILSANGPLSLSIPVNKPFGNHTPICEVTIDYTANWQHDHWNAIQSAYNRSPFFEYYADFFQPFYHDKWETLVDYNTALLNLIFKIIGIKKQIVFTEKFELEPIQTVDFRNLYQIHKGGEMVYQIQQYPQVFDYKNPFVAQVSILDLLFNQGNQSLNYLQNLKPTSLL